MVYRCRKCYRARRLDLVDEVVMGVLVARLSRPDAAALFVEDVDLDRLRNDRDELRVRRDGLARLLSDGLMTEEAVREEAKRLTDKIDALTRQVAEATGTDDVAAVVASDDVAAALARLTFRRLRAVIDAVAVVRILPAGKGVRFDPAQVDVDWKRHR